MARLYDARCLNCDKVTRWVHPDLEPGTPNRCTECGMNIWEQNEAANKGRRKPARLPARDGKGEAVSDDKIGYCHAGKGSGFCRLPDGHDGYHWSPIEGFWLNPRDERRIDNPQHAEYDHDCRWKKAMEDAVAQRDDRIDVLENALRDCISALEKQRREHDEMNGGCDLSPAMVRAGAAEAGVECTCGADAHNAAIARTIAAVKERLGI